MKKRIVSLITCSAIIFTGAGGAYAQNDEVLQINQAAQETVDSASKVYTLSLEDAIKMAHKKDPQYANLDLKISDAEKQLADAKRTKNDMEGMAIHISQGITTFAVQRGYYVNQADISLNSAKLGKQQTLANSAYSITQKYYNVKLAERLVETAENTYELTKNNLDSVKSQFDLGMVAQIDVNNATYSLNQAKAELDKHKRNLDIVRSQLAIALYIEEDNFTLNLTNDFEYEEFTSNMDEDVQKAMQTRYDVYSLDSALSQAEFMLSISRIFGTTSAEYSSANLSKVQCETTNKNSRKAIKLLINSAYNSIIDAEDSLILAQEYLSLCRQSYDIALSQYELGMITNSQLTAAINNITTAQMGVENAKLTHKLAVEKYKYEITIGL